MSSIDALLDRQIDSLMGVGSGGPDPLDAQLDAQIDQMMGGGAPSSPVVPTNPPDSGGYAQAADPMQLAMMGVPVSMNPAAGVVQDMQRPQDIGTSIGVGLLESVPQMAGGVARLVQGASEFRQNPVGAIGANVGNTIAAAGQALASPVGQQVIPGAGMLRNAPGVPQQIQQTGQDLAAAARALPRMPSSPGMDLVSEIGGNVAGVSQNIGEVMSAAAPSRSNEAFTPEWFARGISNALPMMGASVGLTIAGGPIAGGIPIGLLEAGQQANQTFNTLRQQGVPDEEAAAEAFMPAVGTGLVNAYIEKFGVQAEVAERFARQEIRKAIPTLLKTTFSEGAEEVAQGTVGDVTQAAATGQLPTLGEFAAQRGQEAALGSAMGVMGGAPIAINDRMNRPAPSQPNAPAPPPQQQAPAPQLTPGPVPQPAQPQDQPVQNVEGGVAAGAHDQQSTAPDAVPAVPSVPDQIAQLQRGERQGVVVPQGTAGVAPPGFRMTTLDDGSGARVIHARGLTPREIREAQRAGRLGELLDPRPETAPAPLEAQKAPGSDTLQGIAQDPDARRESEPGSSTQPSLDSQISELEASTQQGMRDQLRGRNDRMDAEAARIALEAQSRAARSAAATRPPDTSADSAEAPAVPGAPSQRRPNVDTAQTEVQASVGSARGKAAPSDVEIRTAQGEKLVREEQARQVDANGVPIAGVANTGQVVGQSVESVQDRTSKPFKALAAEYKQRTGKTTQGKSKKEVIAELEELDAAGPTRTAAENPPPSPSDSRPQNQAAGPAHAVAPQGRETSRGAATATGADSASQASGDSTGEFRNDPEEYAKANLEGLGKGKPGITESEPHRGQKQLTFRDKSGKAFGVLKYDHRGVTDIAVSQKYRRQGVAQQLIDSAKARGVTSAVGPFTPESRVLFEKNGMIPQPAGETAATPPKETRDEEAQGAAKALLSGPVSVSFRRPPPREVREKLKGAGFRWDADAKAWTAPRSTTTERIAAEVDQERQAFLAGRKAENGTTTAPAAPTESTTSTPTPRNKNAENAAKLRKVAESKRDAAQAKLSQDRNTNTARRARMAEGVENDARRALARAELAIKIADAQTEGTAGPLANVSNFAQVEQLLDLTTRAKSLAWQNMTEAEKEKHRASDRNADSRSIPVNSIVLQSVTMAAQPTIHASNYQSFVEDVSKLPRSKQAVEKLRRWRSYDGHSVPVTGSNVDIIGEWAAKLNTYGSKGIAEAVREYRRYQEISDDNPQNLVGAVRKLDELRQGIKTAKADPIVEMERALAGRRDIGQDFFPTPKDLAERMVEEAGVSEGMKVLEPSAGNGHIADAAKAAGASVDTVEVSSTLRAILEAKGHNLVASDFMEYNPGEVYDRVVMNPPFSGLVDTQHVRHAYGMLKPGGRVVAIVSESPFFRSDKKATEFREWLESLGGTSEQLPSGTFDVDQRGLPRTNVASRLVIIDKPERSGSADSTPSPSPNAGGKGEEGKAAPRIINGHEVDHVGIPKRVHGSDNVPLKFESRKRAEEHLKGFSKASRDKGEVIETNPGSWWIVPKDARLARPTLESKIDAKIEQKPSAKERMDAGKKAAKEAGDAEEAIRAKAESLGLSRKGPIEDVAARLAEHEKGQPSEKKGTETLADWAEQKIQAIKAEGKKRGGIKRGRNTGSTILHAEIRDAAAIAFLRIVAAGDVTIRSGKALTKQVVSAIAEISGKADPKKVRRVVKALLKDAADDKGAITEDAADAAIESLYAVDDPKPPKPYNEALMAIAEKQAAGKIDRTEAMRQMRRIRTKPGAPVSKTAIEKATGIRKDDGPPTLTEVEAYNAALRAAQKASREGFKAGEEAMALKLIPRAVKAMEQQRARGNRETSKHFRDVIIPEIRQKAKDARKAMAEKFKGRAADTANRRKVEMQQVATLRETLVDAIRENLPRHVGGKFLTAVRDVRTYGAFLRAMARVEREAVLYEGHKLRGAAKKVKAKDLGTLEPESRTEADAALGAMGRLRKVFTKQGAAKLSYDELVLARDEFRAALNVITGLLQTQKQQDKVRIRGEVLEAADLRKDVKNTLGRLRQMDAEDSRHAPEKPWLRRFLSRRTNWERLMHAIDGFKSGGVGMRIFGRVLAAREQAAKLDHEFRDGFAKIVTDNGYKSLGHYLAEMSGTLGDRLQKWVDVPIGGHKRITLGQAAYLYASAGDVGFMARVRSGQKLQWRENPTADDFTVTEADLQRVADAIPENVRKIIDEGKALYDAHFFPRLSAVNKRLKGYFLEKIPGYWGIKLNRSYSEGKGTPQSWRKAFIRAMEEAGYMQERVGPSQTPILIGDFGTDLILRSKSSATVIAKAEVVKTMSRVFLHRETQHAITHAMGAEALKRLEHRISLFSGGELYREATEKQLRKLLSRWARGKTQLWLPTWVRNAVGGTIKLLNEMGGIPITKAMLTPSWTAWNDLRTFSAAARERWDSGGLGAFYSHDGGAHIAGASVREAMGANFGTMAQAAWKLMQMKPAEAAQAARGVGKAWDAFLDSLTIGNYFDAVPAIVAYKAFLHKAPKTLEGGARKKWAARHAMRLFERTANTADVVYANDIQIEARESLMVASMVPFTGDVAKSMNMLAESWRRGPKKFARTAGVLGLSIGASAMISILWKMLLGERDDDKLKDTALQRASMELLSLIPGIGNPLSQLAPRAVFGTKGPAPELESPILEIANTGWSVVMNVADGIERWRDPPSGWNALTAQDKFERAIGNLAKLFGDAAGLPSHYLTEFRRAYQNYAGE